MLVSLILLPIWDLPLLSHYNDFNQYASNGEKYMSVNAILIRIKVIFVQNIDIR